MEYVWRSQLSINIGIVVVQGFDILRHSQFISDEFIFMANLFSNFYFVMNAARMRIDGNTMPSDVMKVGIYIGKKWEKDAATYFRQPDCYRRTHLYNINLYTI